MKSSVERDCYRLLQQIVVERDKVCVRCLENPSACGHHIFTRSRPVTAFLPEAVIGLCTDCHNWAQRNPNLAAMLAISVLGERKYEKLARLSLEVRRYRPADFREIRQGLRMELKGVG